MNRGRAEIAELVWRRGGRRVPGWQRIGGRTGGRTLGLLLLLVMLGPLDGASGQESEAETAAYRAAFDAMMADLSDPARSFAFVEAAVETGDIRGAIAALERILLLRPDLANIKVELGYLYLQAGAPQTAETYLRQAQESGEVPADVQARIDEITAETIVAQARNFFSGSIFTGGQYETNANAGPESLGLDQGEKEGDFSWLFAADLQHAYDLGTQAGDAWLSEAFLYSAQYDKVASSDTVLLDGRTGPLLRLGAIDDPLTLRPFVGASTLFLDDEHYRDTVEIGASIEKALTDILEADAEASFGWQRHHNSDENPDSTDRDGVVGVIDTGVALDITPDLIGFARADLSGRDADKSFESFIEYGGQVGLSWLFYGPVPKGVDRPWVITPSLALHRANYDGTDPAARDPQDERNDTRFDARLGITAPLSERFDLVAATSYTDNDSNSNLDDYDNYAVSVGIRYRFEVAR